MTVYDGNNNEISEFVDGNGNPIDSLLDGNTNIIWEKTDPSSPSGDINLAPYLPQWSVDLHDNYPDSPEDAGFDVVSGEDYDGREGDVGELAASVDSNTVVDLGNGDYNVSTTVTGGGGYVGDGATLYYEGIGDDLDRGMLFTHISGSVMLEGVTIDITATPSTGETTDCGIFESYGCGDCWFKDVELRGQRQRIQEIDGSYELVGGWTTMLLQPSSGSSIYAENIDMSDGANGQYHKVDDGTFSHTDHAYSLHCDPSHEGSLVLKDCHVEGWAGNGLYTMNAPGRTCLWNCTALNNARGNMRPGQDETIVGGRAEVNTDYEHDRNATPIVSASDEDNIDLIGVEIIADGDDWGNNVIEMRSSGDGDAGGTFEFEMCTIHVKSGGRDPIRIDGGSYSNRADAAFEDCWILDEGSATHSFYVGTGNPGGNYGWLRIRSGNRIEGGGGEFDIDDDGSAMYHDAVEYTGTTISASDLGIPSVSESDFPNYYFDLSER